MYLAQCVSVPRGRGEGVDAIYYLRTTNFLQPWMVRKMLEHDLKGVLGYDRAIIICIDTEAYVERFLCFMDAHFTCFLA